MEQGVSHLVGYSAELAVVHLLDAVLAVHVFNEDQEAKGRSVFRGAIVEIPPELALISRVSDCESLSILEATEGSLGRLVLVTLLSRLAHELLFLGCMYLLVNLLNNLGLARLHLADFITSKVNDEASEVDKAVV